MLRKVRIEHAGRHEPAARQRDGQVRVPPGERRDHAKCLKITDKGDSEFADGSIVPKDVLEQANAQIEALGGDVAKGTKPKPATASTQLLGITKASVQSSQLHLGRQLPGNDQGAHRSGAGRPDRSPGRPEGERDPRPLDSGRHRLPHTFTSRKSAFGPKRSKRWRPRRAACSSVRSRCWNRRCGPKAAATDAARPASPADGNGEPLADALLGDRRRVLRRRCLGEIGDWRRRGRSRRSAGRRPIVAAIRPYVTNDPVLSAPIGDVASP